MIGLFMIEKGRFLRSIGIGALIPYKI